MWISYFRPIYDYSDNNFDDFLKKKWHSFWRFFDDFFDDAFDLETFNNLVTVQSCFNLASFVIEVASILFILEYIKLLKNIFPFISILRLFSSLWKYADVAAFSVCSWIAGAFLFQFHSRYLSPKPKNPSFSWRENFFGPLCICTR